MKGWEKTKLSREFDLDECMKDKDSEEEFLLNEKMKKLMLADEETSELEKKRTKSKRNQKIKLEKTLRPL